MERPASQLTPRQLEVLSVVIASASICEAAARLGLSGHTIRNHLRAARDRTGSGNLAQLIAWADDWLPGWRHRRPPE